MMTPKQQQTFEFIKSFIENQGYAPTISEIAEGIATHSRSSIQRHLQALNEEGLITVTPGKRRNIDLADMTMASANDFCLPIMGKIAAGTPLEAISDNQTFNIAKLLLGQDRYILQVYGDSMSGDYICDGDYAICEKANQIKDTQIAVVLIDNSEVSLKRLSYNDDGTVSLLPSNPHYSVMTYHAERVAIQGVFLHLLRIGHTVR